MKKSANLVKGFTMIELLIVIAVLGILAVAVLSAINPIEQIDRSRDTGSRSDAEQLLSAVDRYYTTNGYYPWKTGANAAGQTDTQVWTEINTTAPWQDQAAVPTNVLEKLSLGGTSELKASFVSRITGEGYNPLFVYNQGDPGSSTYVCFLPLSAAFETEADQRCTGDRGSIPDDLNSSGEECNGSVGNFICLP